MQTGTTAQELSDALPLIHASPADGGRLQMIVRRPAENERDVVEEGVLDLTAGLVGDNWSVRGSRRTADGTSHPDMQLNVMNARVLDAVAGGDRSQWSLSGDQLIVDLDLGPDNLPAGTRLQIGSAVIAVTDQPHRGCVKFADRFGVDALRFVNTGFGKAARFRGINARVVTPGRIRVGDRVVRLGSDDTPG